MLRQELKSNNFKYIVESFDNVIDALNTSDNRKQNFGRHRDEYDRGFAGVDNYEQVRDMMLNGWDKPIKNVQDKIKRIDKTKQADVKRTVTRPDVAGFVPIVPNALMGLPKSMLNSHIVAKKSKVLNVLLDVTYPARMTKDEIIDYYSEVFAYLMSLEKQGFRVRITVFMLFGEIGAPKVHVFKLLLKRENQPIDIKRLMFPMIHNGMLRAFGFDWYQRLPDAHEISGYGKALHFWNSSSDVDEVKNTLGIDNRSTFYIYHNSDYKSIFKGIK